MHMQNNKATLWQLLVHGLSKTLKLFISFENVDSFQHILQAACGLISGSTAI
jgi:hypothetical protein